ncbi:hypothetical protein [Pseudorhodoplanes sinuspersici]|uniref:Uncharacterized protein n=1 Tax=Pseudorhodoplanes sinuspersici TaxID=1235591 RepID=A0A1W6ZSQ5_9HYPH|nr:hypothetical protein [Pseudorhodoplanes sinuspersici]ARQ00141.1 hypothetical protein CAK95_14440 [Pseudorhodoplanes sinuspersici]RKE67727.1 hypothetical protein DFP91_5497 [Pseudorhodoplanes sinuspersici]
MRRAIKPAIAIVAMLAAVATATAQSVIKDDAETIAEKDVPSVVTSRMQCKSPSGPVTRRSLAGGFVFSRACTTSSGQQDRLVFATERDGKNARLLMFHRPEGRRISGLGNVTFASAKNEISGTVGRLTRRICRAEGRWQIEGKQPSPSLVYWRQTRDCDGKTGWQVMLNRKQSQR